MNAQAERGAHVDIIVAARHAPLCGAIASGHAVDNAAVIVGAAAKVGVQAIETAFGE